ncbi:MAG TPA: hypothetical protein VHF58_10585 [Solirubrobacterales bacterium]|nr:hypothetical protein [Solirubrobacterales bacterium]
MEARPATGDRLDESTLRTAVGALGIFHVLVGGWQFFFNASFFEHVGRYGAENTHYVGDIGSFTLAIGIALLIAVGRPTWRGPVLYLAAIWYALHAVNHLFDIDENRISDFRGTLDTVLLAVGAVLLAWLARAAERSRTTGA